VDSDLLVQGTLTLEPCADVRIGPGKSITVDGPTASLVAAGTALRPVHIGPHQPGQPFASLTNARNGTLRLTHVTIEGGGAAGTRTGDPPAAEVGTLVMGSQGSAARYELLLLDHVIVEGSASNGLVVRAGANFAAGSTDLVVHGAAFRPLRLTVSSLDAIPTGVYTGNTFDEVLVVSNALGTEVFRESTTLRDLGVPYHVSKEGSSFLAGGLVVGGLRTADGVSVKTTLTLEPGVTLRFESGAFHISNPFDGAMQTPNLADAVLHAVGTAARPIVLTSAVAVPAPGDWAGLSFAAVPDPLNSVSFIRVEYAGRPLDEPVGSCFVPGNPPYAAIRIHGLPASQFITQTTISGSSTNGIDRGWRAPTALDFLSTNTFLGVVGCNQTWPPDAVGACPLPVPCPK
jgi:hypothetical protein